MHAVAPSGTSPPQSCCSHIARMGRLQAPRLPHLGLRRTGICAGSAEELHARQDYSRADQTTADGQVTNCEVDLGFKSRNIRSRSNALAQRLFHGFGMGARLLLADARAREPVKIGELVE